MRYSRFRSTVTGQPASKRNRASEKSRSSKHKKEHQSKKDKLIKSESGVSLSSYAQVSSLLPLSTQTKNAKLNYYRSQFSPSSMASPYMGDTPDDFNTRFLTPCSDDMGQTLSIHPSALEEVEPQNTNLFANCLETDFMNHVDHDPDSSSLSAFEAACDFGSYGSGPGDLQALDNVSQTLVDSIHDWSGHHGY